MNISSLIMSDPISFQTTPNPFELQKSDTKLTLVVFDLFKKTEQNAFSRPGFSGPFY